jgi:asparagine synthase (glutamine-hydrolysing)
MCGIAGLLTTGPRALPDLAGTVEAMIAPIEHRGPDDRGRWLHPEAGLGLGFRRLAILDLSPAGHQPMSSPGGRWVCIFNGEIYNHLEIRRELEGRGVRFRGHSDTETLVAAVEAWGPEAAVRRFVGMFAIALWDREERVLHLVRDRMGIKPLFVHAEPGRVAFASELKSILAVPGLDRTLDRDAVLTFLRRLHVPGPLSVFTRVRKLLPGHILSIRSSEAPLPEPVPYWSVHEQALLGIENPLPDGEEALEALDDVLKLAVRQRMIADVPLGAFLSGGIDSSLVVALMQEASDRPVRTFSIGFDDPEHNEAPHAAAIARHLETDHHEAVLTAGDALALVPALPESFDEPFADPSALPNFLVCRLAKQEATVALSGLGGDEVYGGYNRYTQLSRATALLGIPRPGRRLASRSLGAISPGGWRRLQDATAAVVPSAGRLRLAGEKARKLSLLLLQDSPEEVYRSLMSAWQDPRPFLPGAAEPTGLAQDRILLDSRSRPGLLERAMLSDQSGYLVDDQLVIADRTSMAVSLEVRVPLLDHRAVELSWRLPLSMKIRNGTGKWCLRELLARRVPRPLFERPKVGFSVPLEGWLRGPLRPWAEDLLSESTLGRDGILAVDPVRRAWTSFLQGRGEGALGIWSLLMFQAWIGRWGRAAG